MFFFIANGM